MIERILERLFGSEIYGQREEIEELKAAMGIEKPLEKKTYDDPDLQALADLSDTLPFQEFVHLIDTTFEKRSMIAQIS